MNRYPLWKNIFICVVLLLGLVYTIPNFYDELPAIQINVAKSTVTLEENATRERIQNTLDRAEIAYGPIFFAKNGAARIRLVARDEDNQRKAQKALQDEFNPDSDNESYVVALDRLSSAPDFFRLIGARPMNRGLDLRGGVHFLYEVDVDQAVSHKLDSIASDLKSTFQKQKDMRVRVQRRGNTLTISPFKSAETLEKARKIVTSSNSAAELTVTEVADDAEKSSIVVALTEQSLADTREKAITQNIDTLHNRVNATGVAEPLIQRQGPKRIVVELPGVEDPGAVKDILGRTASLQLRMVHGTPGDALAQAVAAGTQPAPEDTELYMEHLAGRGDLPLLLKKDVELTGENLIRADTSRDDRDGSPAVALTLDEAGSAKFLQLTRENIRKYMAIVLVEKGKGEVVTAPIINSEIPGGRVQISGAMSQEESRRTALLLRSGALAAPMQIVEERTVGPSLGADNIKKGTRATLWGFVVIALFMCIYYELFGFVSAVALTANLLLLVALLSALSTTLTLPGIAAMALTLGMAIDSNVLINERIREELRNGCTPQAAISTGYERAFNTIVDSNVTTLLAGVALYVFGSGPVRGFAVVHCLGIITSMFSAVLVSRMLVNFIYGYRKNLSKLWIGTIWKPKAA